MANFLNGWKNPVFKVYDSNHFLLDTISLPITGSEGFTETIQDRKIEHELLNYTLYQKVYGFTILFRLPYTEYANKETMKKIQQLIRYHKSGYKLVLTPRADVPRRSFIVVYTGDELDQGIKKGGSSAVGNRLVNLEFTTKDLIDDPNWIDPDEIQYTGFQIHSRLTVLQV
ncbi:MAG: hypothetical protein IAE93_12925 [Ignavibacteria bacterium]|nr:hypothetical protein [Ignavibacteria bacterium]